MVTKLTSAVATLTLLTGTCVTAAGAEQATDTENPVRLETIISLATGPEGETPEQAKVRAAKFDVEIDRLLDVLSSATGEKLKSPVHMSGLSAAKTTEAIDDSYVHVTDGQALLSVRNSVVVLEPGGAIESVRNSIVILPSYGTLTNVENSIVLARYKIDVNEAQGSVILSGYDENVMFSAINCVCGGREMLWLWYPLNPMHDLQIVNSKYKYSTLPKNARTVTVDRLDLTPARDRSLDEKVTITAAADRENFALLRTRDGQGEYVARRGLPVLDPDGQPVAAMDGWRLETVLDFQTVFVNHNRRAVLPVVPAEVPEPIPRARPVGLPAGDTKTGPVRVETLIRLATGPDGETPAQARVRAARFDREIERLLVLLSHGSRLEIKPPARMSDLPVLQAAETLDGGYVHLAGGEQVKSAKSSIVVLERATMASAENCIVIVPSVARINSVKNSVVLARYDFSTSADDSVVLSSFELFLNGSRNVCGASREIRSEHGIYHTLFVNTKIDDWSVENKSRAVHVPGLELTPAFDNSLNDVAKLTFAVRYPEKIALLRMKDGKGEYVARYGQPVLDPHGRPVAAFDGWQLDFAWEYAVFVKDGRYAMMEVEQP